MDEILNNAPSREEKHKVIISALRMLSNRINNMDEVIVSLQSLNLSIENEQPQPNPSELGKEGSLEDASLMTLLAEIHHQVEFHSEVQQ